MTNSDKLNLALEEIELLKQQLEQLQAQAKDNPENLQDSTENCNKDSDTESKAVPPKASPTATEREQLEHLLDELKHELSDHQGTSILGAFALGFLLGRIIR
ncbi:hypothetical protein [Thalassotalea sp. PS06]|uniref:hypothetical protein n=1 Tax=Thalassotalea sp. PS06 TaxID=2594005 RepID=UPI0011648235|nr:hypothetical protein [Thalassotalea sp. PS06]QDP02657.1 hypothetical protein FNC98_15670 [Thalassotalea sp. PS06]